MSRPRLLDLFCGAGGAGMGYHRAGFEVTGMDIDPQPNYPFAFHQGDVMSITDSGWKVIAETYDAIHASPPCQAYSAGKNMWKGRLPDDRHPDLVDATRDRLIATGKPYVIENVEGAPLTNYVVLCGDMFGLGVKRHRLFETSFFIWNPPTCRADHPDFFVSVFGGGALSRTPARRVPLRRRARGPRTLESRRAWPDPNRRRRVSYQAEYMRWWRGQGPKPALPGPHVSPTPWMAEANCAGLDPELMFPGRGDTETLQAAKVVCAECPVKQQCLDYAIENGEHFGVWGGTSERERRRIRGRRRALDGVA